MPCCEWDDFEASVKLAFKEKNADEILIDWKQAKRDWKRYHCTGAEAASMQLRDLARDGEYNYSVPSPRPKRGGEGGIAIPA